MASYYTRARSPFYWIRWKRDGIWAARSSGVRVDGRGSLRVVQKMVADEVAKEACEEDDGPIALFDRWVPKWLTHKYGNGNAGTLKRMRTVWGNVSLFFSERHVRHPGEVTYGLCHDYVRWRVADGSACWNTAIFEVRCLGRIMQEAVQRGWILANPTARMGLRSHRCKEKLVITRGDEQKIIAALPARRAKPGEAGPRPWMEEAFLVGMRQGCRLMEIRCPMASVDTERMVITFQIKGGRLHAAPLHPDLLGLVEKARAEKREFLVNVPSDASKQWATFIRKIGFDYTFHCTRVTVVTRLCEAGFSESQTMAYVGHSSHLVHALYRKMRPVSVAALGDALR